jgi:hypothetical protein
LTLFARPPQSALLDRNQQARTTFIWQSPRDISATNKGLSDDLCVALVVAKLDFADPPASAHMPIRAIDNASLNPRSRRRCEWSVASGQIPNGDRDVRSSPHLFKVKLAVMRAAILDHAMSVAQVLGIGG